MKPVFKRSQDLQRAHPVGQCALCGEELYPAGFCWQLGGQILCEDCAVEWIRRELAPLRVRIEEVRR